MIVAGYTEQMEEFIGSNRGLRSRSTRVLQFSDYTAGELTAIFTQLCQDSGMGLSADARPVVLAMFERTRGRGDRDEGNGRLARTQFERTVERQAARLADDLEASTRIITAADIPV